REGLGMLLQRETLGSDAWTLHRAPLRNPSEHAPALPAREGEGRTVTVPGNLQLQLGFADPWLDEPELTTLNHHDGLYTRSFATPAAEGGHVLVCEGVDYFCDVWVNGRWAGHHEGAFAGFELDVTDLVSPAGEANELTLGVSCPWRIDERPAFLQPSTVFSV